MKDLNKYNTLELNSTELSDINGGVLGPIIGAFALAGAAFVWGWELGREYAKNH